MSMLFAPFRNIYLMSRLETLEWRYPIKVGVSMSIFAKRLKAERENRKAKDSKWTQGYVADLIGVARTTYTSYENGTKEPGFEILSKLADVFEVSNDYLTGRSVSRAPDAGRAFYGGGKDWTPEELEAADAYIEMLRQKKKERQERDYT